MSRWGQEFKINTYIYNDQKYPKIATLENGQFVVSWHSEYQDSSYHGAFGQIFNEEGELLGEEF